MARIAYDKWTPGADALRVVRQADSICRDYRAQGYDLTLRQLYYQFVARGLIPNSQRSYNRLGSIVNKARLAGLLDWDFIVDRTRNLASLAHWQDPADVIDAVAQQYRVNLWDDQPTRVEVWVEKEALAGVVGQVADRWDVPYFSCRGYVSQSELWGAGQRLRQHIAKGQNVVVLHLGDHDPSGIDMSRDIEERLDMFVTQDWLNDHMPGVSSAKLSEIRRSMAEACDGRPPLEVRRIALNMDQVEQYDPPPNPAKLTDSRIAGYQAVHGDESWELDALEPSVLDALIEEHIEGIVDRDRWEARRDEQLDARRLLGEVSQRWPEVVELVEESA